MSDSGRVKWADFGIRAASALVLAPLCLAAIWYGGVTWQLTLTVMLLGVGWEWAALCDAHFWSRQGWSVWVCLIAVALAAWIGTPWQILMILGGGTALVLAASRRPTLAVGTVYLAAAFLSLLWLRHGGGGRGNSIFVVMVVWASDSGAYLAGRLLGGPKLAPSLSPGKTWSGAVGGWVTGILIGIAVAYLFGLTPGGAWRAGGFALLLSLVEQAGDLLESGLKRHFGKKDSGQLIPGHGGLLDRLDGLLAAAPVTMLIALAVGRGNFLWH